MYLEGSIEGCGYGDLSPLDYKGLKLWLRSTDGITFQRGSAVLTWRDLSAGVLFTGASPQGVDRTGAGAIYQTPYGLAYSALSGDSWLRAKSDVERFNFLVNGSPYTLYAVFNVISADQGGANTFISGNPQNVAPNFGLFQTNAWASRHTNADLTSMYTVDIPTSQFSFKAGQNVIATETNYGYGSGQNPLIYNTLDGVTVQTARSAYTNPPNPQAIFGAPLGIAGAGRRYLYEIIIYDQSGKSKTAIDTETGNLVNNYIKKRYPGF